MSRRALRLYSTILFVFVVLACPHRQLLPRTLYISSTPPKAVQSSTKAEIQRLTTEVERLGSEGKYDEALPLAERALELSEAEWGPDNAAVIHSLNNLAELYGVKGNYLKARQLFIRALSIRRRAPYIPLELAEALNNLAGAYFANGEYTEAEPLLRNALAVREKALPSDHPDVAESLNNLAALYKAKGNYDAAEPLYKRALGIREKVQGKYHPDVMEPLNNLAQLYRTRGNNVQAEPLLKRALEIVTRDKGPTHPDTVPPLNNLAILYVETGDLSRGEDLLRRGLKIREESLGAEHPLVAQSLHNLGTFYYEQDDYARAEPLLRRALEIYEKRLPAGHPDIAYPLNVLASVYYKQKEFAKAELLLQRSLRIRQELFGDNNPLIAVDLSNLATLHKVQGQYEQAKSLYQRALAIYEKLASAHPNTSVVLSNIADLYVVQGRIGPAMQSQSRANDIAEKNLTLNLSVGSERRKLLYLSSLTVQMDQTISLHLQSAPDSADAQRIALLEIFRRKGRVLDTLTNNTRMLRRHLSWQNRWLFDHMIDARSKLASLIIRGPSKSLEAEYEEQTKRLSTEIERLEARISEQSAEYRTQTLPVSVASIQAAIPPGAALVEFSLYRPRKTQNDPRSQTAHYVAYILTRREGPKSVELGEQVEIESQVNKLRAALRNPNSDTGQNLKQLAQLLDEKVMRPVRRRLNGERRIFVCPDGILNLIPFGAMIDETGHYLIENYSFVYLTSGRDLLRLRMQFPSRQQALVMAAPYFDLRPSKRTSSAPQVSAQRSRELNQQFDALEGTADEGKQVGKLLGVTPLTADKATELQIKRAKGPRILHIATHGFFLSIPNVSVREPDLLSNVSQFSTGNDESPLLRSGLALAGANQLQGGSGEDGILTALEVSSLDLWGTKLVVLSACDTGLGSIRDGEGVYGLRRALVLAGAESQVMSLWKVDDGATRDLMIQYYKRLKRGEGRSEALRQVQIRMLGANGYSHPYYWAGFIASGNWRNLSAK